MSTPVKTPCNETTHKISGRFKTVCTSATLSHFGIDHTEYHYSENLNTVRNILRRKGYSVKAVDKKYGVDTGSITMGGLRKRLRKLDGDSSNSYYVQVPGHALVINGAGETVVDTDSRIKDRRRVLVLQSVKVK